MPQLVLPWPPDGSADAREHLKQVLEVARPERKLDAYRFDMRPGPAFDFKTSVWKPR